MTYYIQFSLVAGKPPKLRAVIVDSLSTRYINYIAERNISFLRTDAEDIIEYALERLGVKDITLIDRDYNVIDTDCLSNAETVEAILYGQYIFMLKAVKAS